MTKTKTRKFTVTHLFHVRFDRDSDQDLEIARGNFPDLIDDEAKLAAQCVLEVEASRKLLCAVESVEWPSDQYTVRAIIVFRTLEADRTLATKELQKELQEVCYDKGGMSGFFNIED